MIVSKLTEAFANWSRDGASLVLASVYETAGSTYSKAGAQMIIRDDGHFQGMLSGGCLEGDLAERAAEAIATGKPQTVSYDLGPNEDELWGLGVGCDGLMRIFLQPVYQSAGYEPLKAITTALAGECREASATIIASDIPALVPGASMVTRADGAAFCDIDEAHVADVRKLIDDAGDRGMSASYSLRTVKSEATVLVTLLAPPPAILVLGAGLDAEPVVRLANEIGWRITVLDHRPAYLDAGHFATARERLCVPVAEMSASLDLGRFAAAIVMSHHLDSDRAYLAQLAESTVAYVGLLGPVNRRERLLSELGPAGAALEGRLFSPAGIDIGGRGPAAIALSIIAEIHRTLYGPAAS